MKRRADTSLTYKLVLFIFVSLVVESHAACGCGKLKKSEGRFAISILQPDHDSGVSGIVTMQQRSPIHPVQYEFAVGGLGVLSLHGVHIHEYGDLSARCQSAGPHYNPYDKLHGGRHDLNRHAGDLGNLRTDSRGVVQTCFADHVTTLYGERSIIGRSFVIHINKDDLGRGSNSESSKNGNSGKRIAGGVIGLTNQFKHFKWSQQLKSAQRI